MADNKEPINPKLVFLKKSRTRRAKAIITLGRKLLRRGKTNVFVGGNELSYSWKNIIVLNYLLVEFQEKILGTKNTIYTQ